MGRDLDSTQFAVEWIDGFRQSSPACWTVLRNVARVRSASMCLGRAAGTKKPSGTRSRLLCDAVPPLGAHRGKQKAVVAVGYAVLVIVSHGLTRKELYHDLGANPLLNGIVEQSNNR